jgi:type II secretory pathway pseudopilin PulG
MKPFFQTTLSPSAGAVAIGLLIIGVLGVFVLLPAISRIADRSAGQLIAQARVIASFGQSAFRSGGAFYRFSVYEQYLVVCFMTARSYSYNDVRLVQEKYVQRGKLTVDLDGIRVALWGNAERVERLATALSERMANK